MKVSSYLQYNHYTPSCHMFGGTVYSTTYGSYLHSSLSIVYLEIFYILSVVSLWKYTLTATEYSCVSKSRFESGQDPD